MSCKTSVAWSPSVATDSCLSVSPSVVWTSAVSLVPGLIVMSSWVTVHLGGWFPCLPVSVVRLILFLFLDFHHSTLADPYHFLGFDNFLCFPPPQLFVCRRNDSFFKVWDHKKKLLEQLSSCFITLCHISMFFFFSHSQSAIFIAIALLFDTCFISHTLVKWRIEISSISCSRLSPKCSRYHELHN